ncbi:YjbF family lipoprotein [Belnapia sp. T6]|uniref:YjbF family lipoprotein n=1 Tax=Belnapia mucosa TaxID=2804532 RepID=A0ABS1V2B6_9PROT|nr:YjbF family lipoprotein [Belnapia mucosa]MBL6455422.1 YjbF family lipoprotein [Belnapia mucosa]
MRALPLLLLALAGCGDTLWARSVDAAWTAAVDRVAPAIAPLEDLPEPDGPALRLWLRGQPTAAVLLQETGERRLWRTAGGVVVATEGGRVTATAGLRQYVAATRFEGPDPLADPAALLDRPAGARRLVDLMEGDRSAAGMRFGVALDCRLRAERTEAAEILLVQERCRTSGSLGFTNRFWVEAEGGAVLRAEQWVGPAMPMLVMEFLSPAS